MSQLTLGKALAFAALSAYPLANSNGSTYLNSLLRVLPVSLIFWAVYSVILYPNLLSPLRHIPTVDEDKWWSPKSLELHRGNKVKGDVQAQWIDTVPHENGLIRYRTVRNHERIIVASPESLREVLVTKAYQFVKPEILKTGLKQFAGIGIIVAEGDEHKAQRKSLMPTFEFRHIKDMYNVMWDISANAVNSLTHDVSAANNDFTMDINEWTSSVTLGIICVAGLGLDLDSVLTQDDVYTNLRKVYKLVFKQERADAIMFFLRVYILPSWALRYVPLKRNKVLVKAAEDLREECRKIIRQRKMEIANGVADTTEKNLLTVALSNGGFTDENLVDQLLTFLAAGHETTATALTWTVYILSVRSDIQTKLRDEIRANLPSPSLPSSSASKQELSAIIDNHMPYLDAVCQEVLRFFAPVPVTFREAAVNTTIQGYKIPKGTQLILCPRGTNRDKALWGEDAKEFNPDRFFHRSQQQQQKKRDPLHEDDDYHDTNEKTAKMPGHRSNFANMTFLHGPRSCIGQSLSKAELAIVTATLIGRFEFALADQSQADFSTIPIRRGATFRPLTGMRVKVKMIDGW